MAKNKSYINVKCTTIKLEKSIGENLCDLRLGEKKIYIYKIWQKNTQCIKEKLIIKFHQN